MELVEIVQIASISGAVYVVCDLLKFFGSELYKSYDRKRL